MQFSERIHLWKIADSDNRLHKILLTPALTPTPQNLADSGDSDSETLVETRAPRGGLDL